MKLKNTLFAGIGLVAVLTPTVGAQESVFPDKKLEDAVRQHVHAKRHTDEPLTREDAKKVWTLKARDLGIGSLAGLEFCTNLGELDLSGNLISDISPLADLKRLQSLDLSNNRIGDIGPLAGLEKLQFLALSGNRVSDAGPLAKLHALNSLYLGGNRIRDLSPLGGLDRLWSLDVGGNPVDKVAAIAKLPRLSTLDLSGCGLSDVTFVSGLRKVGMLLLEDNRIRDLAPLLAWVRKDHEGDRRFAPFLQVYLEGNPLSERARREQVEQLRKLGVRVHLSGEPS